MNPRPGAQAHGRLAQGGDQAPKLGVKERIALPAGDGVAIDGEALGNPDRTVPSRQ